MLSNFRESYRAAPDVHVLPSHLPLGGLGLLPVNAFLITGSEPVLIDTGLAVDRAHFENALWSLVDPRDLRWIFITHDDRDHCGNLKEVLMAAPQATVITNALSVSRLGEEWDVPRHRVRTVNPGRTIELGNRGFSLLRPPSYDSPSTIGVYDHRSTALFTADSFGTVLPEMVEDSRDADRDEFLQGMALFTRANAPWTALADQAKWDRSLDEIRRLGPATVLSSHSPTAHDRTQELIETVLAVPSMDPWLPEEDLEVEAVLARYEQQGGFTEPAPSADNPAAPHPSERTTP
ncbi:MBL fold metallo-hydrolase [Actinoalloteichus hymeniacidonis]|uniref:Metallo-beta-lactamase superfamily enzyme n=1 Tax=Actinoalloteichus hymeniacidonis TaxID=340345 RepID=A0AAC9MZQ5_9PSEU|nr:MBL fold metallo-hydrolase [Actinoalloteichus hymeniacidonis]AOS64620.1 metallo-beta-lactamase superfamily enzyme [Actinoalloteichus hymeniacidonis]MBB5907307.1 flavorubredoxin [Actinoalloteichus hymeniacidonis]